MLPPKKLDRSSVEALSIPLLIGHIYTHERYARTQFVTEEKYLAYKEDYLDHLYDVGRRKNPQQFDLEYDISRIYDIPFKYKQKRYSGD